MEPGDNSLDQAYTNSAYDSSLEAPLNAAQTPIASYGRTRRFAGLRFNRLALVITSGAIGFILLVGIGSIILTGVHRSNQNSNGNQQNNNYVVGTLPLQGIKTSDELQVGQGDHLVINGQLRVSDTVVLAPTAEPSAPTAGQIYYDKTTNQPYYYNGATFVSLAPGAIPQHITALGGSAGVISLGSSLQISGNQLSVANSVLQAINNSRNTNVDTPRVSSLQGLTGDVSLSAGNGVAISGTTISNNGVVSLVSTDSTISITNKGNGQYDLKTVLGGPGSQAVLLGPAVAQPDAGNLSSLSVNKTGSGNFLQFASNGVDKFVVNQAGQITAGTIAYSQVSGAPVSTVTSLGGVSGAIALGAGLGISGGTLSNTGVVSIAGTANQVIASASNGNLTLSLPQSIAPTSTPTFAGETLNGGLSVTAGGASLAGGLSVTSGGANLTGGVGVNGNLSITGTNTLTTGSGTVTLGSLGAGLVQTNAFGVLSSGAVDRNSATLLSSSLNVANGGTGVTSLTSNGILYGNGAGALQATSSANNSVLATNGAGVPGLVQTLPSTVQGNITTTGILATGSINTGFGTISTGNSITTTAALQGGSLNVASGSFTVNGSGNITTSGLATIQGAGGLSLGVAGTTAGKLVFANAGNNHLSTLQGLAPAGQDQTITIPASSASTDTVCLLSLANCVGTGGGVTVSGGTQNYIPKFSNAGATQLGNSLIFDNGTSIGIGTAAPGASYKLDINGNVNNSGSATVGNGLTVSAGGLAVTGNSTIAGTLSSLTGVTSSGTITFSGLNAAGIVHNNASGVLTTGAVALGTDTTGNYVASIGTLTGLTASGNSGAGSTPGLSVTYGSSANSAVQGNTQLTVAAGTGLTGGGAITLGTGGSTTLSVQYGSTTGTAVQGDTTLVCSSGSGNLSGGGNTITLGSGGSCNNISISNNPTFSGTLSVQGAGGVAIGVAGTTAGLVNFANASNTNVGTLQSAALGQGTIFTLPDPGQASATICLSTGNCAGAGSGITGSGTNGKLAKFSGSGSIADSTLSESGSTVTVSGNMVIQGSNSLSIGTSGSTDGSIKFNNAAGTHTVALQAPATDPASNLVFKLPNAYGSNGSCLQSDGLGGLSFQACTGGSGGGVTSLDSQTGVLSLANSSGASGTVTIDNASTTQKGIAQFNSTNFSASSGTINTVQDINSTATPTFGGLTLTTALSVASGGTGASSLTANGILYGSGTGAVQATGTAANSVLATNGSNLPSLTQTLPSAVQSNITTTGALSSGSIASGFGAISTANAITTTASLQGGTLSIASGAFAVDGSGAITAVTGITSSGGYTQSGASANTLTGATTIQNTLAVQGANVSIGAVAQQGSLVLNSGSGAGNKTATLQAISSLGQNTVYTLPDPGQATATICLSSGNCAGAGSGVTTSGGTQNYITKYNNAGANQLSNSQLFDNGSGVSIGGASPAGLFNVGATNQFQVSGAGAVMAVGLNSGTGLIQGSGGITASGTITFGSLNTAGVLHTNASGVVSTSAVTLGSETTGNYVATLGTLTGLSATGNSGAGSTPTLSVDYGSGANTAAQGNTSLSFSGSGNLTGTVSGTAGGGLTTNTLALVNNPTFSGTVSLQNSTSAVLGVAGTTPGSLAFANSTSTRQVILQGLNPSGTGDATIQLPSIAGGSSDTVCLLTLANCGAASGNGNYILNQTTQQVGSNFNIDGTGKAATLNATAAIQLNGININTAGTLNNVAYLDQANAFSAANTFSAAGTALTVNNDATISGTASIGALAVTGTSVLTGLLTANGGISAVGNVSTSGQFQISGVQISSANLSNDANLAKLNATQSFTGDNTFTGNLSQTGAGTFSTGTGGVTLNGAVSISGTNTLTVGTGASVFGGTATVSGLTTLNGGASISGATTITGTTNINTTGTANTTLGNTSGAVSLNGNTTAAGTLAVQGSGGLTLGVASGTNGVLKIANSTNNNLAQVQSAVLGQTTTYTLPDPGQATATICLSTGNCAGSGGGITGSGTSGNIAKFNGTGSVTDSSLSESGTTVTASGNVVIQGAGALTLGTASTNTGSIAFKNSTNANTVTLQGGASGSNFTLTLPTTKGNNGDCLQSDGSGNLSFVSCTGGAGGGVTSLDAQTGVLSLANSSGTSGTITIDNASTTQKGIAQFNSTNFTASSGTINLIQDIATTSTPTFAALTVNGNINTTGQYQVGGTQISSANLSNDANLAKLNGTGPQTFTGNNKFAGTVLNQNAADSTTAFQIQNAAGTSNLFLADTTNSRIGIGATPANSLLTVGTNTTNAAGGITFGTDTNLYRSAANTLKTDSALVVAGNTTLSGTLGVTGSSTFTGLGTFNGGATITTGSTFTNASSTLLSSVAIANHASNSTIGSAASTVDVATTFDITQTTPGITLTLPSPTTTTSGRIVYVNSLSGNASFTMYGVSVSAGNSASYIWNGSVWTTVASGNNVGGGSGVNAVGSIDAQSKSADGAVISGNSIYLQSADASFPGLVTTGAQTLAGAKTFSGAVTVQGQGSFTAAGTGLTVTNNATVGGTLAVTGASTLTGQLNANGGIVTNNANINAGSGTITSGNINGQTISSSASFTGTLAIGTLGAATAGNYLCYNTSNQIANCNTTGNGTAFVQGGNSLGALAVLGTTDANSLSIGTYNGTALQQRIGITNTIAAGNNSALTFAGTSLFKPTADSTTAFQIQNAAGTSNLLVADTTNTRIGLGIAPVTTAGSGLLQVGASSSTTAAQGISFGGDTVANLYRSGASALRTDGSFSATLGINTGGNITITGASLNSGAFMKSMTAGTGGVAANDVVIIANDSGNTRVLDTTTVRDTRIYGVAGSAAIAGSTANIVIAGNYQVTADTSAVAIGDQLVTSTTSGQVTVDNNATTGILGTALSAKAGGSSGLVSVSIRPVGGQSTPIFRNAADSTTALQIQNAAGTGVFQASTTSQTDVQGGTDTGAIGINGASVSAGYALNVTGSINATAIYDGGVRVCTSAGCAPSAGSGNYIQLAPSSAQADATTNSSIFVNKTGVSGNILQLQSGGTDKLVLNNAGNLTLSGTLTLNNTGYINTNSTTALKVEQAGVNIGTLVVDTTNGKAGVGGAPVAGGATLQVTGTLQASSSIKGTQFSITSSSSGGGAVTKAIFAGTGGVSTNDVVVLSTSSYGVVDTTTARDPKVYGVATDPAASGGVTDVAISGNYQVSADTGAVAIGDQLVTSTTSGQVTVDNNATTGILGVALSTKSAGSSGLVSVAIRPVGGQSATRFQNISDSTTAFQIQNAAGTSNLLVADTTNNRLGLGGNFSSPLLVADANSSTVSVGTNSISGVKLSVTTGSLIGERINVTGGSGNILELQSNGVNEFVVANNGNLTQTGTFTLNNTGYINTNNTTALKVEQSGGSGTQLNTLVVDTTNGRVGIGKAPTSATLDVNGSIAASSTITAPSVSATSSLNSNGYIQISNNALNAGYYSKMTLSGTGGVSANDVVILANDSGTDHALDTTTARDSRIYGVATTTATSGNNTYVAISGTTLVNADTAVVAIGDQLVTSTTSGAVTVDNNATTGILGHATTAKAGGSTGTVGVALGIVAGQSTPTFRPASDGTTAFQIQNAAGTGVFQTSTTSQTDVQGGTDTGAIGINGASVSAGYALNVAGSINATAIYDGGVRVCTSAGCAPSAGSSNYIQFAPSSAQADATTNSSIFVNKTGASGNILQLQSGGTDKLVLNNAGNLTASGTLTLNNTGYINTNSTTALKVEQAGVNNGTLVVDTTNGKVGVGGAPVAGGATLQVTGTLQASSSIKGTQFSITSSSSGGGAVTKAIFAGTGGVSTNDVVVLNMSSYGVVDTTTARDPKVYGVATDPAASGSVTDVAISGNYQVSADTTAVAIGDQLVTSTTSGQVTVDNNATTGILGTALSAKAGGSSGLVSVSIRPHGGQSTPTFRNTSDSTTAFQIQNASGATVLGVDTSAGRLVFSGDTTADLYRSSAGTLKTDGALTVNSTLSGFANANISGNVTSKNGAASQVIIGADAASTASIQFGLSSDAEIYRAGVGQLVLKPSTGNDSTTAFQIQNAAGTSNLLVADTSNTRIGIGKANPTVALDVNGSIQSNSTIATSGEFNSNTNANDGFYSKGYNVGSTGITNHDVVVIGSDSGNQRVFESTTARDPRVWGVAGATASSGGTAAIAIAGNYTVNVDSGAVAIGDQLVVSSTQGLATVDNNATTGILGTALSSKAGGSTGTVAVAIRPHGGQSTPTFRNTSNSTTAFQVQNAAGTSNTFSVDTTNSRIGINNAAPGSALDVTGSGNFTGSVAAASASINAGALTISSASSAAIFFSNTALNTGNISKSYLVSSAGGVTANDVLVQVNDSGNYRVADTTTARDARIVGVANFTQVAGGSVTVAQSGNITVNADTAAVTVGDQLVTSATSGAVTVDNNATTGILGIAASSKAGGSTGTVSVTLSIVNGQSTPTFRNTSNSTAAFQVQNAAGTSNLLVADTTNTRIGIGQAPTAGATLQVTDAVNNNFVAILTQTNATSSNGLQIITKTVNSGDSALDVKSNNGANSLLSVRNDGTVGIGILAPTATLDVRGNALFKNTSNSTTAFQVQSASGAQTLFNADTINQVTTVRGNDANSTVGSELMTSTTNFTSNWSGGAGWTLTSTSATHVTGNVSSLVNSALTPTAGVAYQVTFSFTGGNGSDSIIPCIGGACGTAINSTTGTNITQTIVASSNGALQFVPTNSWTGSIALVSVKQVTGTLAAFNVKGSALFQSATGTNSTSAFQIQNSAGTSNLFNADTTNSRIGIGTAAPGNLLSIGALTTAAGTYQVAVTTGGTSNSGIVVQTVSSQSSGYILQAQDSTGASLASIDYLGNLTVKAATINGPLTVNGHIITGNASGSTSATVGASAGIGATCTISGNDTSGKVTITTAANPTSGTWCTINFGSSFSSAPNTMLTPANTGAASVTFGQGGETYVTPSTSSFQINSNVGVSTAGLTAVFNYFNAQ